METTTAPQRSTDYQFGLRMTSALREKLRRAVRRASFERDEDVSMNMFILEAIDEKIEREAA